MTPIRILADNKLPAGVVLPGVTAMSSGNVVVLGGASSTAGEFQSSNQAMVYAFDDTPKVAEALPADADTDGVGEDGDGSGTKGDSPCTGGDVTCCDDNCPTTANPDQADVDGNGVGDACQ